VSLRVLDLARIMDLARVIDLVAIFSKRFRGDIFLKGIYS
jgi:hypothetical protein